MNYNDMITYVDQAITNNVEESYKLNWINELERIIFRDICTEFRTDTITLADGVSKYPLDGYKFEDIEKVEVDGEQYLKMSAINYTENSFYKDTLDIAVFPIPDATSSELKIIYLYKPTPKDETTKYNELELSAMFGTEFENVYEHYLRYKILFHQREFEESNQMAMMYNDAMRTFSAWYLNNVANSSAISKKERWLVR